MVKPWRVHGQGLTASELRSCQVEKVYVCLGDQRSWAHDGLLGLGWAHMEVSMNGGTPKSSILIRFFTMNHPFLGTPILGNLRMVI